MSSDIHFYTVSQKKRHDFYTCDYLVRCHPVLPILNREFETNTFTQPIQPRFIRSYCTL